VSSAWWVAATLGAALAIVLARHLRVERRLSTVASVLASYREGDFSIRARLDRAPREVEDLTRELNALGDTLRKQRLEAVEAWALLRKFMAEVDVVVLAVDPDGIVRLANDAAARALGKSAAALVGQDVGTLHLSSLLEGDAPRVERELESLGPGPWELRRGTFRLTGSPHTLIVLSDVSIAVRESEREAWRRLIRVMGHEINNSLSPIQSMSETMLAELAKPATERSETFEEDLRQALGVVARRSAGLGRFLGAYAKLAKLPPPRLAPVDVRALAEKVALLEPRTKIELEGPDVTIRADVDQLEQVLINLVKNAADASSSRVTLKWNEGERFVEIAVEDEGPGVSDTANLFVPFFTTKPNGSGIGLVLCREIVEAHHGRLTLTSRTDRRGAVARMRLPA
jgi:PAS domain S-box-containing protein